MLEKLLEKLSDPWLIIGLVGQILFFSRFVVQWIASERQKQSVVPDSFWYISIVGGTFLLVYSIYIMDPIFIAGSFLNLFMYGRNIMLLRTKNVAN